MRIEHVALWARDIEVLRAFYERYFAASPGPRYDNPRNGFASYFLSFADGARIELMQMPSVPDTGKDIARQFMGYIHLAMAVGDEGAVDALTARLAAAGHRVIDPPRRTGDGYYESVVLDPEDNRIEIVAG